MLGGEWNSDVGAWVRKRTKMINVHADSAERIINIFLSYDVSYMDVENVPSTLFPAIQPAGSAPLRGMLASVLRLH